MGIASPPGNHSKVTDRRKANTAKLAAGSVGDAVRLRRQYKSADYYEAKAQLMLRITEITTNPDVIVRFFDLATSWLKLAGEARQEAQQNPADGPTQALASRSAGGGMREPVAGFSELSAAKDA